MEMNITHTRWFYLLLLQLWKITVFPASAFFVFSSSDWMLHVEYLGKYMQAKEVEGILK
jgi:hypothetical protein